MWRKFNDKKKIKIIWKEKLTEIISEKWWIIILYYIFLNLEERNEYRLSREYSASENFQVMFVLADRYTREVTIRNASIFQLH